jgi:N4-(beta-N-acetylglucosaminyl)-L-asparaginase
MSKTVAEKRRKSWLLKSKFTLKINIENHNTIGTLCLDAREKFSRNYGTLRLSYKMIGSLGDFPIIGSGLYLEDEVAAAIA